MIESGTRPATRLVTVTFQLPLPAQNARDPLGPRHRLIGACSILRRGLHLRRAGLTVEVVDRLTRRIPCRAVGQRRAGGSSCGHGPGRSCLLR